MKFHAPLNPAVQHDDHKSQALDPKLRHFHPFHTFKPYYSKIRFNIILRLLMQTIISRHVG
jgi:hypothetical protein